MICKSNNLYIYKCFIIIIILAKWEKRLVYQSGSFQKEIESMPVHFHQGAEGTKITAEQHMHRWVKGWKQRACLSQV